MEGNLYAKAERVDPDLAGVIKRLLDSGDLDEAEAELVLRLIAGPVFAGLN
jgi:hypothetical protein